MHREAKMRELSPQLTGAGPGWAGRCGASEAGTSPGGCGDGERPPRAPAHLPAPRLFPRSAGTASPEPRPPCSGPGPAGGARAIIVP